ncbi:hypothetical protein [Pyrococcus kukulkanii]|uniref:hypothetical protein n=1 Tax=Pyrococcus kukulkanii TaxID=1609559 RepID=UPI0035694C40
MTFTELTALLLKGKLDELTPEILEQLKYELTEGICVVYSTDDKPYIVKDHYMPCIVGILRGAEACGECPFMLKGDRLREFEEALKKKDAEKIKEMFRGGGHQSQGTPQGALRQTEGKSS